MRILATLMLLAVGCKSESGVTTTMTQAPFCTTTTPANPSGFYPKAALPTGACKDEPKCQMQIERPCPCSAVGPVDDYTCTCTNASWACTLDQQGGACSCSDAAAD